jgi:hypothetical protein
MANIDARASASGMLVGGCGQTPRQSICLPLITDTAPHPIMDASVHRTALSEGMGRRLTQGSVAAISAKRDSTCAASVQGRTLGKANDPPAGGGETMTAHSLSQPGENWTENEEGCVQNSHKP